jgi:hypothetical protein
MSHIIDIDNVQDSANNIAYNFLLLFENPWFIVALITTFMLGMLVNFILKGYYTNVKRQTQALLIWSAQLIMGPVFTIFFVDSMTEYREAAMSGVVTITSFYVLMGLSIKFKLQWLKDFLGMSFYNRK